MAAYLMIKWFSKYTMNMFFRDIDVVSPQNVPQQGATIVYGNHNNQFVDGLLLLANVKRQINFIAAAVSCRRPIVGRLIKMTNAIPVERPQDLKKKGKGKIIKVQGKVVFGRNTQFKQLSIGSIVSFGKDHQLRVSEVINDFQFLTDSPKCTDVEGQFEFSMTPKIQFNQLYENVWESLRQGKCIGIFPEGGSHDRLSILPLKAGICIMALGAIQKYGISVNIVPCGFHYYHPQNFRSKVIMEFGPPYKVPEQIVELYKVNKKQAISTLLDILEKMLLNVTTNMKTFKELSTLFLCRQLYTMNTKKDITIKQKLQLNRRFAKGFDMLYQKPQNKPTFEKLFKMNEFVKVYQLPIKKENQGDHFIKDFLRFILYLEKSIVRLCLTLPGLILMGPTTTIIAKLAERQRLKCLKASKVKETGADVVGSYKILLSIFFFPFTAIFNSTIMYAALKKFTSVSTKKCLIASGLLAALMPFYIILMVKSYDSLGRSMVKLKHYFIRLFKRSMIKDFNKQKKALAVEIVNIVDKQGEQVIQNFHENRIIQSHEIQFSSSMIKIMSQDNTDTNKLNQLRQKQ